MWGFFFSSPLSPLPTDGFHLLLKFPADSASFVVFQTCQTGLLVFLNNARKQPNRVHLSERDSSPPAKRLMSTSIKSISGLFCRRPRQMVVVRTGPGPSDGCRISSSQKEDTLLSLDIVSILRMLLSFKGC